MLRAMSLLLDEPVEMEVPLVMGDRVELELPELWELVEE